ncbi:MAG: outer membrane beta-barrel protein [Phaeodactylibacter sp.]|nr:outer membrane beta-barrel protein [Phaeodactylibacter sp.]
MKRIFISVLALFVVTSLFAQAQNKSFEIAFYTNLGYRAMAFENLYNEFDILGMPNVGGAFSLGAGSFISNGDWILGLEFYNSRGQADNSAFTTKFNATTNALFVGYRIVNTTMVNLSPIVGFSMTMNTVDVFRNNNPGPRFEAYNAFEVSNMDFSSSLGIQFEAVFSNNMFAGISTGYDVAIPGEREWDFEGVNTGTQLSDRQGGFFINLTLGGHLDL